MPGESNKVDTLSSLLKKKSQSLSSKDLRRRASRSANDTGAGASFIRRASGENGTSKEQERAVQGDNLHLKNAHNSHHHRHAHNLIYKARQRYHQAEHAKRKPESVEMAVASSSSSFSVQTEGSSASNGENGNVNVSNVNSSSTDSSNAVSSTVNSGNANFGNPGSSNAVSSNAPSINAASINVNIGSANSSNAVSGNANISIATSANTNSSIGGTNSESSVAAAGTFVGALCSRIERSLPLRSGMSLAQLDVDPSFTEARRHLISISLQGFLDMTLRELYKMVERILKAGGSDLGSSSRSFDQLSYSSSADTSSSASVHASGPVTRLGANIPFKSPVPGFSVPVLRSLDVVLGLICSLMVALWDTAVTQVAANAKIYRDYGIQGFPSQVNCAIYFTASPKKLDVDVANALLSLIPGLRSEYDIIQSLRGITESPTTESIVNSLERHQVRRSASRPTAQRSEADILVASIDSYVSKICSYLSASNPAETYEYLRLKFTNINIESLYLPSVDVVGLLHLDKESFIAYLTMISGVLKVSRRQSQTALLLSYFADSILQWAVYRTEDFLQTQKDPKVVRIVGPLFDSLHKSMDFKFYHRASFKVLSILLLFLPDRVKAASAKEGAVQRSSFSIKRPALFKSVDPKQMFMMNFRKVLRESPASAPSLTRFIGIGCLISLYDKDNAIAVFARTVFDSVNRDISRLSSGTLDVSEFLLPPDLVQGLERDSFAISMVLKPEKTAQRVKDACGKSPRDLEQLLAITEGLRLLAQIPSALNVLFHRYDDLAPFLVATLRQVCVEIADAEYSSKSSVKPGMAASFKSSASEIESAVDNDNETENVSQNNVGDDERQSATSLNEVSSSDNDENEENSSSSELLNLEEALRSKLSHKSLLDEPISGARSVSFGKMRRKRRTGSTASLKKQPVSKYKKAELRHLIVSNLLDLFKICPFLVYSFLKGPVVDSALDYVEIDRKLSPILKPIIDLLVVAKSDDKLVRKVEAFVLVFPVTITNSCPREAVVGYLTSAILVDAVSQVSTGFPIEQHDRGDLLRLLARLIVTIHKSYNVEGLATTKYDKEVKRYHESGGCRRLMRSYERALFLGLFSNNVYTIRVSRKLLLSYLRIVSSKYHYESCFERATVPFVKSLLSEKLPVGKMAIRKKIRDKLCLLKEPTDLLLDVWNLMFSKLDSTCLESGDTEESNFVTCSSGCYGQYVASLGGIILSPGFETDPRRPEMQQKLTSFLDFCVVSIFSNDPGHRERCREALCVSVHPFLCGKLLLLLEKHLPRFYEALEIHRYVSCGLYIDVVRSVCQIDASEQLFLSTPSLWTINFELLKQLNFVSNDASFLRLKLKFCKLQVLFLSKFDELAMHGSIQNKNEYAKYAAKYMEDSYRSSSLAHEKKGLSTLNLLPFENESKGAELSARQLEELDELHTDIKVEVSVMLETIFRRLPLDTPGHSSKDDRLAATVVFSNYFNMFVRILEEMNDESEKGAGPGSNRELADAAQPQSATKSAQPQPQPQTSQPPSSQPQHQVSPTSMATGRRLRAIVRHVIQALVNLLSSNSSIGLSYALPLGYHEDTLIRVSLINVFAKIVGDVATHHSRRHSNRENLLQRLTAMLFEEKGQSSLLLASIDACPRSQVDPFANALLEVAASRGRQLSTLSAILESEIDGVADSVEILRSNTVATRMVALYSRSEAADYLVDTLHPVLQQLLTEEVTFEIEKVDGQTPVDRERNLDQFLKYLQLTVNAITESVSRMPHGIRVISRAIFNATKAQFPQSTYVALGAYLFLRLYNPSIVSPDRVGVVSTADAAFKRSVIQIARTLQIMVNAGDPSAKFPLLRNARSEQCLVRMSSRIIQFMDAVIDIGDVPEKPVQPVGNAGPTFFHIFLYDHWMAVRRKFVELSLADGTRITVGDTCEKI